MFSAEKPLDIAVQWKKLVNFGTARATQQILTGKHPNWFRSSPGFIGTQFLATFLSSGNGNVIKTRSNLRSMQKSIKCLPENPIIATVNWEIFVYENIHVSADSCKQIFKGALRRYFNTKICQVEIIVHVLPIKWLLATYASLLCYRNS